MLREVQRKSITGRDRTATQYKLVDGPDYLLNSILPKKLVLLERLAVMIAQLYNVHGKLPSAITDAKHIVEH